MRMRAQVVRLGGRELGCVDRDGATGEVTVSIRPERVEIHAPDFGGENTLVGEIERVVFAGPLLNVLVTVEEWGRSK